MGEREKLTSHGWCISFLGLGRCGCGTMASAGENPVRVGRPRFILPLKIMMETQENHECFWDLTESEVDVDWITLARSSDPVTRMSAALGLPNPLLSNLALDPDYDVALTVVNRASKWLAVRWLRTTLDKEPSGLFVYRKGLKRLLVKYYVTMCPEEQLPSWLHIEDHETRDVVLTRVAIEHLPPLLFSDMHIRGHRILFQRLPTKWLSAAWFLCDGWGVEEVEGRLKKPS